ncbi:MAG: NAD(P)-dependent oxidoreductase [Sciscionella sp.]
MPAQRGTHTGGTVTQPRTVAVLGTGIMGYPMAANLCRAGLQVRVFNRTQDKARGLADLGASIADTPAEAVHGADLVVTMVADGPSVTAVMQGSQGALGAMGPEAVWVQMSTVGVKHTDDLAAMAQRTGIAYVDAPVLGTRKPAEDGTLVVLAAGTDDACASAEVVFDAVGARTIRAGALGSATKLKLVANNWVLGVTSATAECVALAQALDLDPAQFLDAISGGALDLPYAHLKGNAMITEDFPLSFPLSLAAKDARLVLDAAGSGVNLAGTRATLAHLEAADEAGHGGKDMAALYYGVRR